MVDASILQAVQEALVRPPPAIVQDAPIPAEAEAFFTWQAKRTETFERHSREYVGAIRESVDNLIRLLRQPDSRDEDIDLNGIVEAAERGLALSAEAVGLHQAVRNRTIAAFAGTPFQSRVRKAANLIASVTARQHDQIVEQYYRILAARADHDPDVTETVATASTPAEVRNFFEGLRAT